MVFSPVPFQYGQTAPASFEQDTEQQEGMMTSDKAQRKWCSGNIAGNFQSLHQTPLSS
jgi:phosphoribosyl-AMP cyclohydrolase